MGQPTVSDTMESRNLLRGEDVAPRRSPNLAPRPPLCSPTPWTGSQTAWILTALVVLAVLPRAVMAFQQHTICDDGYYYLWAARMWQQGRVETALQYLNVNVYPLLLWVLESLSLELIPAARTWGVLVSGLTVLPLFSLLRNLLGERAAAAGCFLFATHPELIEMSFEPIREPTYWFLFTLSLAWVLRAGTAMGGTASHGSAGRGWRWSVPAGVAVALTVHTRSEGWALLVPMLMWTSCMAPTSVSTARRIGRLATMLAMIPLFLVVVNVTLLKDHPRWEWGRFTAVRHFGSWLGRNTPLPGNGSPQNPEQRESTGREKPLSGRDDADEQTSRRTDGPRQTDEAVAARSADSLSPSTKRRSNPSMPRSTEVTEDAASTSAVVDAVEHSEHPSLWEYIADGGQKLEYINLILILIGLCMLRAKIFQQDLLPFTLMSAGFLLAVWVYYVQHGFMNGRYFLSVYFTALPTAAVGARQVAQTIRRVARRRLTSTRLRRAAVPATALLLVVVFWIDVWDTDHETRDAQADVGIWLRKHHGPFEVVETDTPSVRIAYHAQRSMPEVKFYDAGDGPPRPKPDVVILQRPVSRSYQQRIEMLKLRPLPADQLPTALRNYRVYLPPGVLPPDPASRVRVASDKKRGLSR